MKVIDLLNKMVNKEEIPKKIKFEDDIFQYDDRANDYLFYSDERFNRYLLQDTLCELWQYSDEVEIIEEDKKIEKLIEPIASEYTYDYAKKICHKINQIIDIVNKLKVDRK